MILTKKLKIKVSNSTTKHYKSKGYICNSKDVIEISVNDLPIQSTKEIKVKCDICGDEKIIQYRRYINNKKNKNFYVCSLSCAQEKIKLTKIENHGDPSFSNIEKRKETCKERYNNETYKNVEKRTETNLEKYGTEHAIMNTNIKNKREETYKNIYGEIHPMKNNKIVDKKQDTCLRLYGNKGYNNIEKIKMTKIKKGLQIPDNLIHDYSLYRRKCSNYINKNRNYLLEKWNGYDYYDNEYIKDYLEYDQKHKFYPTIDHKISVLYGFINKIPLDVINSENNLCFTKRCINSSKGSTCS